MALSFISLTEVRLRATFRTNNGVLCVQIKFGEGDEISGSMKVTGLDHIW